MEKFDLGYDLEEALIRTNISKNDLERLRKSVSTLQGVPKNLTDKQLLLFLNACGSIEEATNVIKIYYDSRKNCPEHFNDRDPYGPGVKKCFENQHYFVVKPTETENCPIIFDKLKKSKASDFSCDNSCKTFCMTIDTVLYKYGAYPGLIFVHDTENAGFGHLLRTSISTVKKYAYYLQYGLPAKLCRIHILNVNIVFEKLFKLMTPFLKKDLLDVIHVHSSRMDFDEFCKNWIPKSHLPADYGGDLKTMQELTDNFYEDVKSLQEYFAAEELQRANVE